MEKNNSNDQGHQSEPFSKEEREPETCFIITPIGAPDSDINKKTNGLLSAVIEPVLRGLKFKAVPAHHIASPGSIPKQILRHLVEDKLVIANLTGLNPNVMYELAVRHAVKLPLVMMAEYGTDLPFDVKDQRTIFYDDSYVGVEKCKVQLETAIQTVLAPEYVAENPIYDAIQANSIIKNIAPESNEDYLFTKLEQMEAVLMSVANMGSAPSVVINKVELRVDFVDPQSLANSKSIIPEIFEEHNILVKIDESLYVGSVVIFADQVPYAIRKRIVRELKKMEGVVNVKFIRS